VHEHVTHPPPIDFVLTRQGGSWLISAAQNTEINRTVK
jgi:hypothetical protein